MYISGSKLLHLVSVCVFATCTQPVELEGARDSQASLDRLGLQGRELILARDGLHMHLILVDIAFGHYILFVRTRIKGYIVGNA
jgi:hypothetical protein